MREAHQAQNESKFSKAQRIKESQKHNSTGQRYFVTANQLFVTATFMRIKTEKVVNEEVNYSNGKGDL